MIRKKHSDDNQSAPQPEETPAQPQETRPQQPEPQQPPPAQPQNAQNGLNICNKRKESSLHADKLCPLDKKDLDKIATAAGIENVKTLHREQILLQLIRKSSAEQGLNLREGVLEILPDGYGFLRSAENSYLSGTNDIYVHPMQIKKLGLKTGDILTGVVVPPRDNRQQFQALTYIEMVNHQPMDQLKKRISFEELTPLYPDERYLLETEAKNISMRVMDMLTPIGKGQRGLIVAPPRTGKTIILQQIANSIAANSPTAKILVLLIDERPEEVTDMKRTVRGEVVSSTFDEAPERHIQVAEIVIEKAKRLVEYGHDVVILLDSLTRLARAYNTVQPHSGKIMTGGVDAYALHKPKKFFGAARNIEHGGSLTIIATCLVDTGSRMDEVIFEEFKGTGNMEINLDRKLVDKRIFPAINIEMSGTRKEELLLHPDELQRIWTLRKAVSGMNPVETMELIIERLRKTKSNAEFLMSINKM
jgi:transcription termination factor Rho